MSETDSIQFLSNTIRGLKSALLDSSKEISQLKDSYLSLYVKFTKEQVKSMELTIAYNKINAKCKKELNDSQLEVSELRKELLGKENENINLNFKVKELQAHVEEKTRQIESFNITVSELKAEKQSIPEVDDTNIIEVIKASLKKADEHQGVQILKELKKFLKKFKKKEVPGNLKKTSAVKSEENDLDLSDNEIPDVKFKDSVVFDVLKEMNELKRMTAEIETFRKFCDKENIFLGDLDGFSRTSKSSDDMAISSIDESPADISIFSGCSGKSISVKFSEEPSIFSNMPDLENVSLLNITESAAILTKRKNDDTFVKRADTKKQKLEIDNGSNLDSEKSDIEMDELSTNDEEDVMDVSPENAVSIKSSVSPNIICDMPDLHPCATFAAEKSNDSSVNLVDRKTQKLDLNKVVDYESENSNTEGEEFLKSENRPVETQIDDSPKTSKSSNFMMLSEIGGSLSDTTSIFSVFAENSILIKTSESPNINCDMPALENASLSNVSKSTINFGAVKSEDTCANPADGGKEVTIKISESPKNSCDLSVLKSGSSLNILESSETLSKLKGAVTSINLMDTKKEKLDFNFDVHSASEKSDSEDESLKSDAEAAESNSTSIKISESTNAICGTMFLKNSSPLKISESSTMLGVSESHGIRTNSADTNAQKSEIRDSSAGTGSIFSPCLENSVSIKISESTNVIYDTVFLENSSPLKILESSTILDVSESDDTHVNAADTNAQNSKIKACPAGTVSIFSPCLQHAKSIEISAAPIVIHDRPALENINKISESSNIISDISANENAKRKLYDDIRADFETDESSSEEEELLKSDVGVMKREFRIKKQVLPVACDDTLTGSKLSNGLAFDEIKDRPADIAPVVPVSSICSENSTKINISDSPNNIWDADALRKTGSSNKFYDKENVFSVDKDNSSLTPKFSNVMALSETKNSTADSLRMSSVIKISESTNNHSADTEDETLDFYNGADFQSKKSHIGEKELPSTEESMESKHFNKENISNSSNGFVLNGINKYSPAKIVPSSSVCSRNATSMKFSKPSHLVCDISGLKNASFSKFSVNLYDRKKIVTSLKSADNKKEKLNFNNRVDFDCMKSNFGELRRNDAEAFENKTFDKENIFPADRDLFLGTSKRTTIGSAVESLNNICDMSVAENVRIFDIPGSPSTLSKPKNNTPSKSLDSKAEKLDSDNCSKSKSKKTNVETEVSLKSDVCDIASTLVEVTEKVFLDEEVQLANNNVFTIVQEMVSLYEKSLEGEKEFSELYLEPEPPPFLHEIKNEQTDGILLTDSETEFIILAEISENSENCDGNKEEKRTFDFDVSSCQHVLTTDSFSNLRLRSIKIESKDLYDFSDWKKEDNAEHNRVDHTGMLTNTDDIDSDDNDNLVIAEDLEDEESIKTNKDDSSHVTQSETGSSSFSNQHNTSDRVNENRRPSVGHVLPADCNGAASPAINGGGIFSEPRTSAPRYNFRHQRVAANPLNSVGALGSPYAREQSKLVAPICAAPSDGSMTSERISENGSIVCESHEIAKVYEIKEVEISNRKPTLPKFYVENKLQENRQQFTYLTCLDEVWSKIKGVRLETSSTYETEATDLIGYTNSVVHAAFYRKKLRKPVADEEKISKFTSVKETLKTFVEGRIKESPTALKVCLKSLRTSNKNTISCALVEFLRDTATEDAETQNRMAWELLTLCFEIERNVFSGFLDVFKTTLETKIHFTTWKENKTVNVSTVSCTIVWSRFFTKLCKQLNQADDVVKFVHRSLMSLKFRAHPIAYSVMIEWAQVFYAVKFDSLLVQIILFTLVHHKMKYNGYLYKANDVQELIGKVYNIKLGTKTAEEYAKEAMLKMDDESWVDAVVLLCKRQMFCWAYTNVIMKYILPIINKWKMENFKEAVLIKILHALQEIMASCPVGENNKMYKIDSIVRGLSNILILNKGSRQLKETVAVVLCELGTVRFSMCAEALLSWTPSDGLISAKTLDKLHTSMLKKNCFSQWCRYVTPKTYAKGDSDKNISSLGSNYVHRKRKLKDNTAGTGQAPKKKNKKKRKNK